MSEDQDDLARVHKELAAWARTTSSNNLCKAIAKLISAARTEGYMAGYEAGKKSSEIAADDE